MCTYHYHSFKPTKNALIIITVPKTACYHYHSSKKLSTGGGVDYGYLNHKFQAQAETENEDGWVITWTDGSKIETE